MTELVRYDAARAALEEARNLDEVKEIHDRSAALLAYARQRDDADMERWVAEIKLRAIMRIGELSKELETNERARTDLHPNTGKQTKRETLASAGISTSEAHRAEKLSERRTEVEEYIGEQHRAKRPITAAGAIGSAVVNRYRGTQGSGDNEWFTPVEYVEAARGVLGAIDLDPASSDQAQQTVKASKHFTAAEDGLAQEWHGRIWLNPPYAQPLIAQFVEKMVAEFIEGRVTAAIMLTHNYTDTTWFHTAAVADAICFTRGRIRFQNRSGDLASPTQGQAFFYFGDAPQDFAAGFAEYGFIVASIA